MYVNENIDTDFKVTALTDQLNRLIAVYRNTNRNDDRLRNKLVKDIDITRRQIQKLERQGLGDDEEPYYYVDGLGYVNGNIFKSLKKFQLKKIIKPAVRSLAAVGTFIPVVGPVLGPAAAAGLAVYEGQKAKKKAKKAKKRAKKRAKKQAAVMAVPKTLTAASSSISPAPTTGGINPLALGGAGLALLMLLL